MPIGRQISKTRFRGAARTGSHIRLAAALGLLASGLLLLTGAGVASATTRPGHKIATAGTLTMGPKAKGGGGAIDFWKVKLYGGDQVQFVVNYPIYNTYVFALYAPGTTDTSFPNASSFSAAAVNYSSSKSVIDLQAPYNGTFILAVCENVSGNNCANVDSGSGTNPMNAYSFTPTLIGGGISGKIAAKETRASATIKKAPVMGLGHFEAGGANPIDFWKVKLNGGDQVQIATSYPIYNTYVFALYPPGTTDTSFPNATTFSAAAVNYSSSKSVIDLQAPYNGTFILAVCENVSSNNCVNVDSGSGTNPMSPYTFTPTLIGGGISGKIAAKETRASATIKKAPVMGLGHFEAGGANPIDFWKVKLHGGQQVQLTTDYPIYNTYVFSLYPPGTTDTSFPSATAVSSEAVNYSSSKSVIDLKAPRTGTFILAVCENVSSNNCDNVDSGSGTNPMSPYTYATKPPAASHGTSTSVRLSASTITYGKEKTLKVSVTVRALSSGHPTGKVTVSAGKKVICTARLSNGKGSCSPASGKLLAAGKYSLVGSYRGNLPASKSPAVHLTVKK